MAKLWVMRFIISTLMFLACMLQSAMPLQAGLCMSMPLEATLHASSGNEAAHGKHSMPMADTDTADHADPSSHPGTMIHCAACLLLVPELRFAEKGHAPGAYLSPDLQQAFVGNGQAPPVPPPRA